ncbi:MAG: MHYT domain-containing protein [Micromonosporaceae bacterium]
MAPLQHFTSGWASLMLAGVVSVIGCLLGLLLATKARRRTGRRRVRLLVYASVAVGATAVWFPHIIAMLGVDIDGAALRYDARLTAASLAVAVVVSAAGLFLFGHGRLGVTRLAVAGLLIGSAIAAGHDLGIDAVRVSGTVLIDPIRVALAIGLALVTATAGVCIPVAVRGLGGATIGALILAGGIGGTHHLMISAVGVHLTPGHHDGPGLDPMVLIGPVLIVGAAVIAMLAFFTFGNSTMDEMRAIYDDGLVDDTNIIAARIIAEVTTRVSSTDVNLRRVELWPERPSRPPAPVDVAPDPRRPRPRPRPAWANMPVWGEAASADPPARGAQARPTPNSPALSAKPWTGGAAPPLRDRPTNRRAIP